MVEMMYVSKYYCNVVFVSCGNYFVVVYWVVWLDNGFNICFSSGINIVMEWEEGVRGYNRIGYF